MVWCRLLELSTKIRGPMGEIGRSLSLDGRCDSGRNTPYTGGLLFENRLGCLLVLNTKGCYFLGGPDPLMPAEWQGALSSLLSLKAFFPPESLSKVRYLVAMKMSRLRIMIEKFSLNICTLSFPGWKTSVMSPSLHKPSGKTSSDREWAWCRNIVGEAASNSSHIVY